MLEEQEQLEWCE